MLFLFLAAQAAPAPRAPEPYRPAPATVVAEPVALMFAGFDRDGDGRTTSAECRAGIDGFAAADPRWARALGYLEFGDWAERYVGDRNVMPSAFEVDRDGDMKVTLDELRDRIDALFARLDTNRDAALTRGELLTIRANAVGGREREGRDRAPPRRR